jgi:hypothetical protein
MPAYPPNPPMPSSGKRHSYFTCPSCGRPDSADHNGAKHADPTLGREHVCWKCQHEFYQARRRYQSRLVLSDRGYVSLEEIA